MASISINGHEISPESHQPGGDEYVDDASGTNYILIHCSHPLTREDIDELRNLHVQVLKYHAQNTYSCRYEPENLNAIRNLSFVEFANVYVEKLSVSPNQRELLTSHTRPISRLAGVQQEVPRPFHVILHDAAQVPQTIEALQKIDSVVTGSVSDEGYGVIRACFKFSDLDVIAKIDHVAAVHEISEISTDNYKARNIMGLGLDQTSFRYSDISYGDPVLLRKLQALDDSLRGRGQTVVVADTGLDLGDKRNLLNRFTDQHPAFTGRVKAITPYNAPQPQNQTTADGHGHGTHVSGSVLGSATTAQGLLIEGTAPEAHLIMMSTRVAGTDSNEFLGQGDPTADLWRKHMGQPAGWYGFGAAPPRVHNNSWGSHRDMAGNQKPYEGIAFIADSLVYENQDWVICFTAGNDGEKVATPAATLGGPGCAKNIITVGATENMHPLSRGSADVTALSAINKYDATQPPGATQKVAAFSGRGPVVNTGRRKPDVLAPGCMIYSACSRYPNLRASRVRRLDGTTGNDINKFGITPDPNYWYMSGTSMACPLVSGCCASLRNAYSKVYGVFPSASMVKALLVNGAKELTGYPTENGGPAPNNIQGFGRVNMINSILPLSDVGGGCYDSWSARAPAGVPLTQGEEKTFSNIRIPVEKMTLTVTLAYPDKAGEALTNCLALGVTTFLAPDFPQFRWAEPKGGGAIGPNDGANGNNVQRLVWKNVPVGKCEILVRAVRTLLTDPLYASQHYAVCWDLRRPYTGPVIDDD